MTHTAPTVPVAPAAPVDRRSRAAWTRVAQRVAERRQALGLSVEAAAARGGVDVATWQRIEQVAQPGYRQHREAGVCRALGWTPDSIDRILSGGEPAADPASQRSSRHSWPVRALLRPVSTRGPDGRVDVCPARVAVAGGVAIEVLAVVWYFR